MPTAAQLPSRFARAQPLPPAASGDSDALEALHSVNLRPTTARVQLLEFFFSQPGCSVTLLGLSRLLAQRGVFISPGSMNQCVRDLQRHGLLLREKFAHEASIYRLNAAANG